MDDIDRGQEREQIDRERALSAALNHEPPLPAIGICYNCEVSLPPGVCFCDCDCRNDYEMRQRMEAIRGY